MHTTTAVFVNEPQSALLEDVQQMLERLVPRGDDWKHNDPRYSDCDRHNADAHLRAIMLGSSVTLQVAEGALTMGQWQRVLMAELDGRASAASSCRCSRRRIKSARGVSCMRGGGSGRWLGRGTSAPLKGSSQGPRVPLTSHRPAPPAPPARHCAI
jgi:secondary thiamine-phosphate synthase enzyme